MEDDLVGVVIGDIACQGSGQLEGNGVEDIVVSGILPCGEVLVGGIVDILDLLLDLGDVGLIGDRELVLLGQLQQSQVVDGVLSALFEDGLVNDQVVAGVQSGLAVHASLACALNDVGVSDLCKSHCIVALVGPAGDDASDVSSSGAGGESTADGGVCLQGSQECGAVDAVAPGNVTQSCIVLSLSTSKNLVCFVGVARQVCIGLSSENGSCQSEDHDQGQQDAGDLSHVFHSDRFLSFLGGCLGITRSHQEDAVSSFLRLVWLYNRVRPAAAISSTPPIVYRDVPGPPVSGRV